MATVIHSPWLFIQKVQTFFCLLFSVIYVLVFLIYDSFLLFLQLGLGCCELPDQNLWIYEALCFACPLET